jgi:hypothetical protein
MSRDDMLPVVKTFRPVPRGSRAVLVLIEVPKVRDLGTCPRAARRAPYRLDPRAARRPARRRLRREFRVAARMLLALLPILWAGSLVWSRASKQDGRAAAASGDSREGVSGSRRDQRRVFDVGGPPAIALMPSFVVTLDPAVAAAAPDPEAPVVFPGYLLPVDSLQESVHEGN